MTQPIFISKKEAAVLLDTCERTIDEMRKQGLPCYKFNKKVKFIPDEIIAWAKSYRQGANATNDNSNDNSNGGEEVK